jgi:hypothetical protein
MSRREIKGRAKRQLCISTSFIAAPDLESRRQVEVAFEILVRGMLRQTLAGKTNAAKKSRAQGEEDARQSEG